MEPHAPPSTGRGLSHWSEASHIWEGMLNRVGEGGITPLGNSVLTTNSPLMTTRSREA